MKYKKAPYSKLSWFICKNCVHIGMKVSDYRNNRQAFDVTYKTRALIVMQDFDENESSSE